MDIQSTPYTPIPTDPEAPVLATSGSYGTPGLPFSVNADGALVLGLTTFGASQLDAVATQAEKCFYVKLNNAEGDLDGFTVPAVAADPGPPELPAYPERKLDIVEASPGVLSHVKVGTVDHNPSQLRGLIRLIRVVLGVGTPWTPPAP